MVNTCTNVACALAKNGGLVNLPLVTIAGLADSLNPCAITMIIVLLTWLIVFARKPKRVVPTGLIYIAGVFITYLVLGLFFYKTISQISQIGQIKFFINKFLGTVLLIAGLINIKDFFYPQVGPHLEVPDFAKGFLKKMAQKVSYPLAFILGILVTILGTPCSLPIYVGTIHILSQAGLGLLGLLGYFVYYNLLFTLPLWIILFVIWKGSEWKVIELQDFEHRGKRWMRLGIGIMLLVLGGWLIL